MKFFQENIIRKMQLTKIFNSIDIKEKMLELFSPKYFINIEINLQNGEINEKY